MRKGILTAGSKFLFLLQLCGMHHHGNNSTMINVGILLRQAAKRVFGFIKTTSTDEEPRGFRTEVSADKERNNPDPLDSETVEVISICSEKYKERSVMN